MRIPDKMYQDNFFLQLNLTHKVNERLLKAPKIIISCKEHKDQVNGNTDHGARSSIPTLLKYTEPELTKE